MTTYIIHTPACDAALVVSSGIVIQAAPFLNWTLNGSFNAVLAYCKARGWTVEPLIEETMPDWFEADGILYSLSWNGETLARITRHDENGMQDITFNDLPDVIKRAF